MGFGDVGHVLTNTIIGSSDQDWTCYSSFVYSRDGSAGHAIEYDGTNWIDHSSTDWPTHFGTSSTDSTAVTPVGTDTDLYLWNGSTFVCKVVNPDPESSGPTVTSITVANQIASTRQFTVTHTGTLSATDIEYMIDGSDITSLGSPNTPITNIQSTSTGSTFDSYTISKNGSHFIKIGSKTLNFYVNTSTSARVPLDNSTLSVTFPTTSNAWLQHVSNNYNSATLYSTAIVYNGFLTYGSGEIRIQEYLRIGTSYQTNGFYWKLETWDFATADSNTGKSYTYTPSTGYVDPVALLESTGSPNTTIPVSAHFLTNSTFNWDFASENAQAQTTTSNEGGRPNRYPLIMTNLFNRNRSLYSIGMTHKDTWDLFL